ncbi:DUF3040 domain-containing protein [Nonomuraea angiospora]|uniref:DUF3040 domain-containing protein n=1 Tax=Nonomuraea angiospora TaxID=46172 RepID=UPI0037BCBF5D
MDSSEREHRLLEEIEQHLRHHDRAFAWRMDALNTASARQGPQRYACHTTRRELVCVFLAVVILTALSILLILTVGRTRMPPATPADTPVSDAPYRYEASGGGGRSAPWAHWNRHEAGRLAAVAAASASARVR